MPLISKPPVSAQFARWALLAATLPALACHCESADLVETTPDTSSSGASNDTLVTSTDESTGASLDLSRWIGRHHFELRFLPFGERGDPMGSHMLMNFEIFPDSTASLFYDDCSFTEPVTITYEWTPDEPGWLELHPGTGRARSHHPAREPIARPSPFTRLAGSLCSRSSVRFLRVRLRPRSSLTPSPEVPASLLRSPSRQVPPSLSPFGFVVRRLRPLRLRPLLRLSSSAALNVLAAAMRIRSTALSLSTRRTSTRRSS